MSINWIYYIDDTHICGVYKIVVVAVYEDNNSNTTQYNIINI